MAWNAPYDTPLIFLFWSKAFGEYFLHQISNCWVKTIVKFAFEICLFPVMVLFSVGLSATVTAPYISDKILGACWFYWQFIRWGESVLSICGSIKSCVTFLLFADHDISRGATCHGPNVLFRSIGLGNRFLKDAIELPGYVFIKALETKFIVKVFSDISNFSISENFVSSDS